LPKHKTHKSVDKIIFGKAYPEVHKAIDSGYAFLGPRHRRLFHTVPEAAIIGTLETGEIQGGVSGVVHVLLDRETSKHKTFKQILESLTPRRKPAPKKRRKKP
jgi:hypothetical protein